MCDGIMQKRKEHREIRAEKIHAEECNEVNPKAVKLNLLSNRRNSSWILRALRVYSSVVSALKKNERKMRSFLLHQKSMPHI